MTLTRRKHKPMTDKKPDRVDCRPHLQWVRGFNCCVAKSGGCNGKIQSHHCKTVGSGGGDNYAVPLCATHHTEWHNLGRRTFDRKYNVNLASTAMELWLRSPHGIRWRRENT